MLIAELEHVRGETTSELSLLAVDLDELGEALDQSPAGVSYLDLTTATLWPAELLMSIKDPTTSTMTTRTAGCQSWASDQHA